MKSYGKLSRYESGVTTVIHRNKNVTTSVGTIMDDTVAEIDEAFKYRKGRIPIMHAHRPDLISNTFYDSPRYWWLMMHFNNVNDPFEGFNSGDEILIPKL